jgi:hypothetical protein
MEAAWTSETFVYPTTTLYAVTTQKTSTSMFFLMQTVRKFCEASTGHVIVVISLRGVLKQGANLHNRMLCVSIMTLLMCVPGVGCAMVTVSLIVCIYYNVIMSYTVYYMVSSFASEVPWSKCDPRWADMSTCYVRGSRAVSTKPVDNLSKYRVLETVVVTFAT